MSDREIYITKFDLERLWSLIDEIRQHDDKRKANLDMLEKELDRGLVVEPDEIPKDVITMNSRIVFTDLDSGATMTVSLVFPSDANFEKKRISILSPIGTALLGYRVGDTVEWNVPSGTKRLRVDNVVYQPEAAGDYHL
ncbi:MAG: Regulator of nucleoside diphosphate kinase [Syntrophus sp. PtaU1.Bin005]|jgi:regulator of nucleoside diphosphate kinase|uniref:nucleoside diphosphate kinase regulator n=1 Tax=Syntrophus TaxID=43773 RepID=UPI0009D0B8B5|nr:MAG: Regulator of nucleoside diphosphate kinase [Syntrophus sp. PtaB.Bin138]OPY80714.1 MAG: Regulator of nucleoside diphosphate kinase [Syntrophus sp. PtaU1.Bin005]